MNALYHTIGISKQAVNQYGRRQAKFEQQVSQLILEADELRAAHPGCGVEKLYYTLKPDFIGRDRFTALLMQLGYAVKRPKNYRRTTFATKLYYPNLIKGLQVNSPSVVWQSDITFIAVMDKFYYAVFIIDVFTKKIVGYQVSDHLRATANMKALKMAIKAHPPPAIHHSDRGSQYTYKEYIKLLKAHNCKISMGLIAQENAYAERIHRTIKEEYLNHWKPNTFSQLKYQVKKAVQNYNLKRIHNAINRMTPTEFEHRYRTNRIDNNYKITIFN